MVDPMTKVSILSPLAMLQMHHHEPKKSWIRRYVDYGSCPLRYADYGMAADSTTYHDRAMCAHWLTFALLKFSRLGLHRSVVAI
ncbi:unnamed protein product [Nippostrongylus brasiliensis]|uniref:Protein kinase domain-containing protein n=1 Tax=Nippostrongylus brasiliensis TaxID=27835 RepID=A0A0N4YAE9_NIPBR|nr:unnamed protein product [Nippostrongylus brasiliensis]